MKIERSGASCCESIASAKEEYDSKEKLIKEMLNQDKKDTFYVKKAFITFRSMESAQSIITRFKN